MIVGGSFAGFTMAELLWDHFEVVVIDMKSYYEFLCSNIKCAVDDKWVDTITVPYDQIVQNNNNKFKFIQGSLE